MMNPSNTMAEESKKAPIPYPLSTCLVSGEKLGVMGPPFVMEYQGREICFCCQGCVSDFNKDPEKYLKILISRTP